MEATGRLVSGVAHELNNPLTAILGFSQLIRRDPDLPEELRPNADLLIEEAARTRRIVQNLLDFARQRPPERHPTSIATLIDSVLALQTYALGSRSDRGRARRPRRSPARRTRSRPGCSRSSSTCRQRRVRDRARRWDAASGSGPPGSVAMPTRRSDHRPGRRARASRRRTSVACSSLLHDEAAVGRDRARPPVSFGIVHAHGGELRYVPSGWGTGAAFTFELPVHGSVDAHQRAGDAWSPASVLDGDAAAGRNRRARDGRSDATADPRGRRRARDPHLPRAGAAIARASPDRRRDRRGGGRRSRRPARFDAILCDHQMAGMSGREVFQAIVAERPGHAVDGS